jgi:hypothetical protein
MTQKTYNHYSEGKLVATYNEPVALARRKLSLTETIQNYKRSRRDARLVNILTR